MGSVSTLHTTELLERSGSVVEDHPYIAEKLLTGS